MKFMEVCLVRNLFLYKRSVLRSLMEVSRRTVKMGKTMKHIMVSKNSAVNVSIVEGLSNKG